MYNRRIVKIKDTMEIVSCVILLGSSILILGIMFVFSSLPPHTIYILLIPYLGIGLGSFFWLLVDLLSRRMPGTKIVIEDSIFWNDWWNYLHDETC